jgi:hypothetical protein
VALMASMNVGVLPAVTRASIERRIAGEIET